MRRPKSSTVPISPQAALCAVTPLLAALLVHPVLEQALNDDFSYTRTAQILAKNGHIVYNAWATAMLGWQLYLGALFIRLFGFSFTAVRLSLLPVAMLNAFLLERSFVRSGLREAYATLGALTIVLSPLLLPLTFSFMSDLPGLFLVVLCFYSCLRVLAARTTATQIAWLLFAIFSNAVGGTVRQIAWLGLIVMIPCLLVLLRRQRTLVLTGIGGCLAGVCFLVWMIHWFNAQPNTIAESAFPAAVTAEMLHKLRFALQAALLEFASLLLPVTACFLLPALRRRSGIILVCLSVAAFLGAMVVLGRQHQLALLMQPTLINNLSEFGAFISPLPGAQKVVLGDPLRLAITGFAVASAAAACALIPAGRVSKARQLPAGEPEALQTASTQLPFLVPTPGQLATLVLPFCLFYLLLLLPRGATVFLFDRYLLPLMVFAILGLLRLAQGRVGPRVPAFAVAMLVLFAGYAIAITHDLFAVYRARLSAINQIIAAGVPPNQINGGFEFNGWQEILLTGRLSDPRLPGTRPWRPPLQSDACAPFMGLETPHLERRYALAWDPAVCDGRTNFPPVDYRTWLPPREGQIYIVRDHGNADGN
jgi:hypothetical protein